MEIGSKNLTKISPFIRPTTSESIFLKTPVLVQINSNFHSTFLIGNIIWTIKDLKINSFGPFCLIHFLMSFSERKLSVKKNLPF